jgi:hypothetical protein
MPVDSFARSSENELGRDGVDGELPDHIEHRERQQHRGPLLKDPGSYVM